MINVFLSFESQKNHPLTFLRRHFKLTNVKQITYIYVCMQNCYTKILFKRVWNVIKVHIGYEFTYSQSQKSASLRLPNSKYLKRIRDLKRFIGFNRMMIV